MTDTPDYQASQPIAAPATKKTLSPEARRALDEATARREAEQALRFAGLALGGQVETTEVRTHHFIG